ncbi:hypothetical protein ACA910_017568 [Epithemia clementina (nom. ined.)]
MSALELLRLSSAASVILVGCMTVGLLLSTTIHLPPCQIEEVTLISLDGGLATQIEETLVHRATDEEADLWNSQLDIIENEAKDSGISLEDLWSDDDEDWASFEQPSEHRRLAETELSYEVIFYDDQTDQNVTLDNAANNSNDGHNLTYTVLPAVIVATSGLIILCALLVWYCDARERPLHTEAIEKSEVHTESNRETSQSTTSEQSCICAVPSAQCPVLPPIDYVLDADGAFVDDENPLSPVSSMTASLLAEGRKSTACEAIDLDVEAATDSPAYPINDVEAATNSSAYPPDVVLKDESPIEDRLIDGTASVAMGASTSSDRSGVSALTEDNSVLTEKSAVDSVGSSHQSTQCSHNVMAKDNEVQAVISAKTAKTTLGDFLRATGISEKSIKTPHGQLKQPADPCANLYIQEQNDQLGPETASIRTEARDEQDERTNCIQPDGNVSTHPSLIGRGCIRDIVLVGSGERLGLETRSEASTGHPVITHVSEDSPLVGNVFAGDVILNISTSSAENDEGSHCITGDENKVGHIPAKHSRGEGTHRSIQLTVLSCHEDASSMGDTESVDPLEHDTIAV